MKNFFNNSVSLFCILIFSLIFISSHQAVKAQPFAILFDSVKYIKDSQTQTFDINCGDIITLPASGTLTFIVYSYSFSISNTMLLSADSLPPGATFPSANGLTYVQSTFTWVTNGIYSGNVFFRLRGTATNDCMISFDLALPVELTSFTSFVHENDVTLKWQTGSEINNSEFLIERTKSVNGNITVWNHAGSVSGNGTKASISDYTFTDRNLSSGVYHYRLKQTDFNGNFEYHYLNNDVWIGLPEKFELSQNYPNPFNPSTNIEFGIPKFGFVSLKIFDASGKEVMTLINEVKTPGYYSVKFVATGLSNGIYFYRIITGDNIVTRRMILVK